MRAFPMLRSLGWPVVFDVTHSLQLPGAGDGVTAGQAEYIETLASAGVAAGVDAVFLEVHEHPEAARSDAQNALRLDLLPALLERLTRIDAAIGGGGPEPCARPCHPTRTGRSPVLPRQPSRRSYPVPARCSRPRPRPSRRSSSVWTRASSARSACLAECRGRVLTAGMGKSGIISRKLAATLSSTGTPAFFLHPAEAIHGDLGAIQADDVVIALSYSGETQELLRLLEFIRRIGARLIAMTGNPRIHARPGRRRDARLPRRRGSLPAEPGADGEHDRSARARRRPGDDPARAQGVPSPRTSPSSTRAEASASG